MMLKRAARTVAISAILLIGSILSASATELKYFQTFTNVDYTSAGVGGLREVGRGQIDLTGVSGTVTKAFLYWHGHGHPNDYDPNRTTGALYLTDLADPSTPHLVTGDLIGTSGSDGWAFDPYNLTIGQAFRADVTSLVHGNGSFFVSNFNPFALTVQGASLVVIFDDGNPDNNRDIVIADGCDQNSANAYDAGGWNISFPGVRYALGDSVEMEFHVSDGQTQYLESAIYLNGQLLAPTVPIISTKPSSLGQLIGQIFDGSAPYNTSSGFRKAFFTGSLWDIKSFNIVPLLLPGINNLYITSGYEDDDLTVVVLIAKLKSGASVGGQPENNEPVVSCSGAVNYGCATSRGLTNITQATISDPDGDPITLTWRLNGAVVGQASVAAGLSKTPTTFSVTNVLTLGTYNISAVVQDIQGATANCDSIALVEVDTTPPIVDGGPAITVVAASNGQAVLPNVLSQVVATDLCTPANQLLYTQLIPPGTTYTPGTYQIGVTVTDANGNTGNGFVTFIVLAPAPPPSTLTINCPPDASLTKVDAPVGGGSGACTFTQGGWGATANGNNPGSILANWFSKVYPKGYVECGVSGYFTHSAKFTSATAIRSFLPSGGTPGSLNNDCNNATSCSAGVFAGQVLALQLNVDFGDANVTGFKGGCGDYVFHDSSSKCDGKTVRQILGTCNLALSGWNLSGCSISELNALCDNLNQAFDGGQASAWCASHLTCSSFSSATPVPAPSQTGTATVIDTCDTNPTIAYSDEIKPGDCAGSYTILRTWSATDACGNSDTCTQVISVGNTKSSLCGNVFLDSDGGARLCYGNPGISGVVVKVKNSSGTVMDTTQTDASGGFCFFGLPAGTYTVVVTPPAGYAQTGGTVTSHWQDSSGRDCWRDNDGYTHYRDCNDRDNDSYGRGKDCWTASDGYTHWRDSSGRDCWQDYRGYSHSQSCSYTSCDSRLDNSESITLKSCENRTGVNFAYTGNQCKAVVTVTGPNNAKSGDTITYNCTVVNTGTACFTKGCKLDAAGTSNSCSTLKPGASWTFQVKYKTRSSDAGNLACQAVATCSSYISNPVTVQSICYTQIKK
jgi:hypothetical protein